MLKHNDTTRMLLEDTKLAARWHVFENNAALWEQAETDYTLRQEYFFSQARKALPLLLTTESAKTIKSLKINVLTGILYMAPADECGYNVCPFASPGCKAACLGHSSGHMGMTIGGGLGNHKRARVLRTWAYLGHRALFMAILRHEIRLLVRRAWDKGLRPFVRLNGTSDLPVETWGLMERSGAQFYDYTKNLSRAMTFARGGMPKNYHLTFSRSEENQQDCDRFLASGGNVAAVFLGKLPTSWRRTIVVDGDKTDARPDDRHGVYVGLTTKGPKAARDQSGFVIRGET